MSSLFYKTLFLMTFLFFSLTTQASLKDQMEESGRIFKKLAKQYNDPSLNTESAQLSAQLVVIFEQSIRETPDTIQLLPSGDKAAALVEYKNLLQQEIDLGKNLQKAFETNDNSQAFVILKKMSKISGDGHDLFKED